MFRRRRKLSPTSRMRALVWPRSGWRRASKYLMLRLRRLPGTPFSIAAGFACGAAVSFTPFIGMHFMLAALIAWIIGANVFASAIGTAVGNPWTFPIIWLWIYRLGLLLLGQDVASDLPAELSVAYVLGHPWQTFELFDIFSAYILSHPWQVFLPMLVGGLLTAVLAWICFYWPLYRVVASYQRHRRKRVTKQWTKSRGLAARQESGG